MRRFYCLLFTCLVAFKSNVNGQKLCHTPQFTDNLLLNKSEVLGSGSNDNSYCLRVYFHIIRRDDGSGGQDPSVIEPALNMLNEDFNPHNISFSWDNQVDIINNTQIFDMPDVGMLQDSTGFMVVPPLVFTINFHIDGIDIYLFDDSSSYNGGLAYNVGGKSAMLVGGAYWDPPFQPILTTHTISHEMGHVLFLWHTHHGTFPEGGNDAPCSELVDFSNSEVCGDYVSDTPADINMLFWVDTLCQWMSSGQDINQQPYDPDEGNFMAYTRFECMAHFSENQGLRMRNAIANLQFLQECIVPCCSDNYADLYIKDNQLDSGVEPNSSNFNMWESSDIWVRNTNDNGVEHQNPDYSNTNTPNYLKVRIKNRSCIASSGNERLKLYWAKASTSLGFPNPWFGGVVLSPNGASMGDSIETVLIPIIPGGGEVIVTVPWVVPNPANYSSGGDQWHFCILARIISSEDVITYSETTDLNANVRNNNNVAWKNITVVDVLPNDIYKPGGIVGIGNPNSYPQNYYLEIKVQDLETGKPIYQEAEVRLVMDSVLYDVWSRGGQVSQMTKSTIEQRERIMLGNNVKIQNLMFGANEHGKMQLIFNFLTKELTEKNNFSIEIIQRETFSNKLIGGETFIVNKNQRTQFNADAPQLEVNLNEPITISATDINEPAIYNWYDAQGALICQGKDLQIANAVAENFKLEVIATTDGFKDYKEVDVVLKPCILDYIAPNPVIGNILNIHYNLNNANSAYLMVIGLNSLDELSNNYILDMNSNQTSIDLTSYATGYYTIALVANGEITDAKIFIRN